MVCSQSLFLGQLLAAGSYVLFEINVVSWRGDRGLGRHSFSSAKRQWYTHHVLKRTLYKNSIGRNTKWGKKRKLLYMSGAWNTQNSAQHWHWSYSPVDHPKPHCSSVVSHWILYENHWRRRGSRALQSSLEEPCIKISSPKCWICNKQRCRKTLQCFVHAYGCYTVKSSVASPIIFFCDFFLFSKNFNSH